MVLVLVWAHHIYPYGGYGYGYSPWGLMPKEQEIAMLEDQAGYLERELGTIRSRLEELRR